MSIRIEQVELYRLSVSLNEPFVTSLGVDESAHNIVVVIRTDKNISGFGECNPFMPVNGESADTCFIVGQYFARALKGTDALDIEGAHHLMDRIIYANTSIKSAFDIALHDIAAQAAGLPLYQFLGAAINKPLVTDYTVSIGDIEKMAADAKDIVAKGFSAVKVKLGETKEKDTARIKAIREAIGPAVPLRIDANQGWDLPTAIETLQALAVYDIEHCEEPIPRWQYMELPRVKKESPIPIMADESCGDAHDAERLIAIDACDYFNIKIGKTGGIGEALKIARLAEKAGIQLQVGAFVESRLAMTAFAHFALCSENIVHIDFDTALMFSEDPVSGGIIYEHGGVIRIPDTPGLGAWIEEERLRGLEGVIV